jgi:hypothetical protein
MSRKFAESEKYFRVCNELVPRVTKNPVNIFNAKRNLLTLYTYSDINKAQLLAERMMMDIEDYLPAHNKELTLMMGNINLLNGDYVKAKEMYRHGLKSAPQPQMEAHILNNLAFASWMHLIELPKTADESLRNDVVRDESYVA